MAKARVVGLAATVPTLVARAASASDDGPTPLPGNDETTAATPEPTRAPATTQDPKSKPSARPPTTKGGPTIGLSGTF